ncbi:chorismate-binding protein [Kaistella palustris]|uniref:chorismate-binding protein n=1 Tax=Kaistella palustris TaxID=493376 RepID=UPI0003FF7446|nr:chorismate-binding protein [Kaistella palustris]
MLYFRFPFSDQLYTTDEDSSENAVTFHSFDENEKLFFTGNITEISERDFLKNEVFSDELISEINDFTEESRTFYEQKISEVIDVIKQKQLAKVVISRRKLLDLSNKIVSLSRTFLQLCNSYPNALVYFFIKGERCWLGAFSELLGKFNRKSGAFETMSLAGTLPLNETWSAKETEEQMAVTDFIKSVLVNYSQSVEQGETCDHISGNIKHLRTDFKAAVSAEILPQLIAELHPTPAVCGIPKAICKDIIDDFEEHPRKFYAGYIEIETEGFLQYFVNLRCAEFFRNAALIYVGGGITADSQPAKEWQETELKAEALLNNIIFAP